MVKEKKMKVFIEEAKIEDKEFILYANKMIDIVSVIEESHLSDNLQKDYFENHKFECLLAKCDNKNIGLVIFSKVYWADRGEGIYVSQIFVEKSFRRKGVFKSLLRSAFDFYKETQFLTCLVSEKNENMIACMENLSFEDEKMITYVKNKQDLNKIL